MKTTKNVDTVKEKYEAPELNVVAFSTEDILTASSEINTPLQPFNEGEE